MTVAGFRGWKCTIAFKSKQITNGHYFPTPSKIYYWNDKRGWNKFLLVANYCIEPRNVAYFCLWKYSPPPVTECSFVLRLESVSGYMTGAYWSCLQWLYNDMGLLQLVVIWCKKITNFEQPFQLVHSNHCSIFYECRCINKKYLKIKCFLFSFSFCRHCQDKNSSHLPRLVSSHENIIMYINHNQQSKNCLLGLASGISHDLLFRNGLRLTPTDLSNNE